MIRINKFYLNYSKLHKDSRYRISDVKNPVFSWAAISDRSGACQSGYRIVVSCGEGLLWDSGKVKSRKQSATYSGEPLPIGIKLDICTVIWDDMGKESEKYSNYFYCGVIDEWRADWIAHPDYAENTSRKNLIFQKNIDISESVESACLFVCGLGYHKIAINGRQAEASVLDPAHSDYSKAVYYAVMPEISDLFVCGSNELKITVADGWRNIDSGLLDRHMGERRIKFEGIKQLSAILTIKYKSGEIREIYTDSEWLVCVDESTESNIFDGETLDLSKADNEYKNAAVVEAPGKNINMRAQALQPIRLMKEYGAIAIYSPESGVYVADFGQNIAGVARLTLPKNLTKGQKITIKFAEVKNADGTINQAPLREAKCVDIYIAAGNDKDLEVWQPSFTYHGFRYAQIEGLELLDKRDISAVSLYTDIDSDSIFECGDALVNKIHRNAVMTERANMHSILTDCPQRDERMGWMNDATVRFEETPYNFDVGHIFPKIVRDIVDAQSEEGAITCTAPFVFGSQPADPVCSSFLIAGYQALAHTGNLEIIREAYDNFKAWEDFLLSSSDEYIVNYSYYGDWASPAYACDYPEGARSAVTPGILMSTGYSYFNAKLISEFADMLGYKSDAEKYADIAETIRAAFLEKWFDKETCTVASGSQASHAFALWLRLIPKEYEEKVAEKLKNDLVKNNYRITTGNLCTRYLFDVLAKYGYIDMAWELITRQEYPSYGYMIQNEATTVWERFELKLDPGMNSHNHPMYGSIDYWFYAYLAGVKPVSPAFEEFTVEPYYPEKLLSVNAVIDTIRGDISIRWIKQHGNLWLYLTVPFGAAANVRTANGYEKVHSGSHKFLIREL